MNTTKHLFAGKRFHCHMAAAMVEIAITEVLFQGDGEVLGLAAECAAEVELWVARDELFRPERPLIAKPGSFVALACRPDYAAARDLAVQDATRTLARLTGVTEEEAYLYCTTVGDLRNGAVWSMGKLEPAWMRTLPLVVGLEVPLVGRLASAGD